MKRSVKCRRPARRTNSPWRKRRSGNFMPAVSGLCGPMRKLLRRKFHTFANGCALTADGEDFSRLVKYAATIAGLIQGQNWNNVFQL